MHHQHQLNLKSLLSATTDLCCLVRLHIKKKLGEKGIIIIIIIIITVRLHHHHHPNNVTQDFALVFWFPRLLRKKTNKHFLTFYFLFFSRLSLNLSGQPEDWRHFRHSFFGTFNCSASRQGVGICPSRLLDARRSVVILFWP